MRKIKLIKEIVPTEEFTDITDEVQKSITKTIAVHNQFPSTLDPILCIVYSPHTTACIRLLENEVLLKQDMKDYMERMAPSSCLYRHDDIEKRSVPPEERRNGYSHLRAMSFNHQEIIPIIEGKLDLGKWQRIFYIECDLGKDSRKYNILLVG